MTNVSNPSSESGVLRTDEEIARQMSALSTIDYAKDSVSSILRLPTETLEAIFIDGARDHFSTDNGLPVPTPPTWINISYVCSRWRNVAMACPTLWSYLFVVSPRWTKELLYRSKHAPLKIRVTLYHWDRTPRALRFVKQVVNHAERIQLFSMYIPSLPRDHQVFSQLFLHAPLLQNVMLLAGEIPPEEDWISSIFLDGDTPALRTMDLSNFPVPWYSLKLNNLTTLSLRRVHARFQQNTEEFLTTLSYMQDLRHLDLDDALASAAGFLSSAAFDAFQKFSLPHLSRLSIFAPLPTIIALLSCVNFPLDTEVRIKCHHEDDSSFNGYVRLSSLLEQIFHMSDKLAPSIPTIRSLIMQLTWEGTTLVFGASELDIGSFSFIPSAWWARGIPLQIIILQNPAQRMTMSDRDRIITEICCSMPLINVQSLLSIAPPMSSAFWRTILGHLQDLRRLALRDGRMPDLISVLRPIPPSYTEDQSDYGDGVPARVLAPGLEVLQLSRISFLDPLDFKGDLLRFSGVQSLHDALSSRKDSRGQLTMTGCFICTTDRSVGFGMVGTWEDGHFHVVKPAVLPV